MMYMSIMDIEESVNWFYRCAVKNAEWRYRKTLEDKPVYCLKCGHELEWVYLEREVYGVRCCQCDLVTLTWARKPQKALESVGSADAGQHTLTINNQFSQFGNGNIQLANTKKIVLNDDGITVEEW